MVERNSVAAHPHLMSLHEATRVYALVDLLDKLLVKCLESPEIFVEIPQKLEVSSRTKPFSIAEETLDNENLLL
jgi:hypothetical protein